MSRRRALNRGIALHKNANCVRRRASTNKARYPLRVRTSGHIALLVGFSTLSLAGLLHCDGNDRSSPLATDFGNGRFVDGGGSSGTRTDGGTSGGQGTDDDDEDPADPFQEDDGEGQGGANTDPNAVTPEALDGTSPPWDNYPGQGDGQGGPRDYGNYPEGPTSQYPSGCPIVQVGQFQCAAVKGVPDNSVKASVYIADVTQPATLQNDKFQFLISSDFGGMFPLGWLDLPGVRPRMLTYPFPKCKRCVTISMIDANDDVPHIYFAVAGMLLVSPFPFPAASGKIEARVDWAVLLEHKKGSGSRFNPVPGGKCFRLPRARISVQQACPPPQ